MLDESEAVGTRKARNSKEGMLERLCASEEGIEAKERSAFKMSRENLSSVFWVRTGYIGDKTDR